MKKKTKTIYKILSVFLAFLIVAQILPLQVLAESITDAIAHKEFIEDVLNNPTSEDNTSDAEILYEVEEKRDEYTKVYKKSDGTYTAVKTKEPLHYLNDGTWEEINNSMSLNGNLYTNLDNLFNVELPKNIDSNENLTVEKDGYELSFSIDNIEESSAVVENDIVVSDTNISVADEAISQTQSSVTYNDVAENTDLQYIVTPNSIKENIIVSNKESVKDTYTFTFETNGLNAEKLDDGGVVFKDENNEIKFRIPRPVMTDSSLAISYDINVVLIKNADDTITLEYSPSSEWTSNSNRVYPITIDPAINVEINDNWVNDTWVMFDSRNENAQLTNGYNDSLGGVCDIVNSNGRETYAAIYTKINTDSFSELSSNIVITEAQYIFVGASANGNAIAKRIENSIDFTTATYNTEITFDDEIIDYYTSPYIIDGENANADIADWAYIHFNITKPLNEWINNDETNNGFAILPGSEGYSGLYILNGTQANSLGLETSSYIPSIIFDYVDMGGYNENYNYHTQSAGRAGTGYVNDFTQQLSILRDDISIDDNIMPVTVGMTYNSVTYNKMKSLNDGTMMAYGNGWTPNYLRAFVQLSGNQLTYFTESGSEIDYTFSVKNDEVIFKEMYSSIYGDHEYEIEYFPATSTESEYIVITRPDGYIEKFNSDGLLTSVTKLVYTKQTEDGSNEQSTSICTEQSINIEYEYNDDHYRINYITDFTGKVYDYVYFDDINENDKNLLSHITYYTTDNSETTDETEFLTVEYKYDETNNLIEVEFPDGKSIRYEYNNNGNMKSMTNIDDYRITYEYEENSCVNHDGEEFIEYTDRITNVVEQAKNGTTYTNGNSISYERLNTNQIKLTDATGDYEIYHFGTYGNLLYTVDNDGNYVMHEDVDSTEETHFASVSDYRAFSENLLSNPSFEETSSIDNSIKDWITSKTTCMQSNDVPALFGTKVLKISSDKNESVNIKQTVDVISGGKYTFSAYVYTEVNANPLTLKLYYDDMLQDCITTSVETTNGKWERYTITLNAPANTETITVELATANGGVFYIDGVQLEQSSTASLYNYISNGSFNKKEVDENSNGKYMIDSWSYLNNPNVVTETVVSENINGKIVNALILPGGENEVTEIYQTISIDGKKNDVIRVGGWFKGNYVKSETNNVWLKNIDEESEDSKICNFTKDRYAQIELSYQYQKQVNEVLETIEEKVVIPFSENMYDWQFAAKEISLKGNCETVTILLRYSKNMHAAMFSNIELTKTKIRTTSVKNNDKQCPCVNCTIVDCSCNCSYETYCYCSQCMQREQNSKKYAFANMSIGNNYDEIITTQLLTQRVGNNITANFNLSNGFLKSVYDASKAYSSYTHDKSGVITQISSEKGEVIFTYNNDKLHSINQNGTIYKMNYDIWGQLTQVSIGNNPIVSYQYDSEENRDRIIQVKYHNSDSTHNTTSFDYNDKTNSIIISINDQKDYTCTYDKNGILSEILDENDRKIYYTNNGTEIINSENNILYSSYKDTNGDIVETIDDLTFTTKVIGASGGSGSYIDQKNIVAKNGKAIGIKADIDDIGRYSSSLVQTEKLNDYYPNNDFAAVMNTFDYDSAEKSITYESYATYDNEADQYSKRTSFYKTIYDYDDNGNIIQKTVKNVKDDTIISNTSYAYTNLNQLSRINDENNNITYYYSYDSGGNIDFIQEYPYTTGELKDFDIQKTIDYSYTDKAWKDKLTDFGDIYITYDNIGNPLRIGNKHFTWSGKQLETYVEGNKEVHYEYDVNGLCYKKTVTNNNITEKYDYIWHEGKLISQIYTVTTEKITEKYILRFAYDVFGTPYGFILNGPNNTEKIYLFMKNLEGDIIGIVNDIGDTVLTYEYNTWGVTKTNTEKIGNDILKNVVDTLPLRYRGYCYDNDIGLYYIQGRYYSPEMCRFINADSTSNLGSTGTALSYNLYAYCENNPMMYIVDNKNTEFSNTINSNYLYNKSISENISGYIDNQGNGVASKLRYGLNSIGPVGCSCVASYNALIMLGNRMEIYDIIRELELNSLMYYGVWGAYPNNIPKFFATKGYDVTITDLREFDLKNEEDTTDSERLNSIVSSHDANIMFYNHKTAAHFIALKYDVGINKFVKYNINSTADNVEDFLSNYNNEEARLLISISVKEKP